MKIFSLFLVLALILGPVPSALAADRHGPNRVEAEA